VGEKPGICVFDIDGVLFDVSRRLSIAQQEARGDKRLFWEVFLREDLLELDTPRRAGIEALVNCIKRGLKILILTGRPEHLLEKTLEQLSSAGIDLKGGGIYMVMRPSKKAGQGNPYRPPVSMPRLGEQVDSKVFKLRVIEGILKGFRIIEIHEDDEEVLREVGKRYPGIKLYIHDGDSYREYRIGSLLSYSRGSSTSS